MLEFEKAAKQVAANPQCHGWSREFAPDQRITVSESGVTITRHKIPGWEEMKAASREHRFIGFNPEEVPIAEYAGTKEEVLARIREIKELDKTIREKLRLADIRKSGAISLYELAAAEDEKRLHSFSQDDAGWRARLLEEHNEYVGRY